MDDTRLRRAKLAYTTRNVPVEAMARIDDRPVGEGQRPPESGDLVLARVDALGQHPRLESRHGRRSHLFVGDEVIVCFGNRYAPDQFEAELPADLAPCDLVAAGGVASRMLSANSAMGEPTSLSPAGFVCDAAGKRLNLADFAIAPLDLAAEPPLTLAVVGSSMNAGKTTAAVNLVRGLSARGLKVGAAKVTGTGAGGDVWRLWDAGAHQVLDFTDAGFASTYGAPVRSVEHAASMIRDHLVAGGAEAIVLEVADGVTQCETAMLLRRESFVGMIDRFVFAAGDALGALAGLQALRDLCLPVAAVSGLLTASPLATREAERLVDAPVIGSENLCDPDALEGVGLAPPRRGLPSVVERAAARRERPVHSPAAAAPAMA